RQRRLVRRVGEEIVTPEAFRVRQIEGELARTKPAHGLAPPRFVARRRACIERARQVLTQGEAHEHAGRCRQRHREEKTDKTEEIPERKESEDQPYRMQADAVADELGLQKIALDELTEEKQTDHDGDWNPLGPKLREGNA